MKAMKKIAVTSALLLGATGAAHAIPSASFIIDGDTFSNPFTFSNTSDAGEFITGFTIDISTVVGPAVCFDTVSAGPCNDNMNQGAGQFSAANGTAGPTGLVASPTVADGATTFSLSFTDFGVGDVFSFDIDVDFAGAGSVTVNGDDLIGATGFFDFSDGQRLTGVFDAVVGNNDASAFRVTGIDRIPVPAPASLVLLGLGLFGLGVARRRA